MKIATLKRLTGRIVAGLALMLCWPLSTGAQVNGEYRSAVTTGVWSAAASWETYSTSTTAWAAAAAAPSGIAAIVSVRNGHTIQLTGNISFKKLTIDAGGSVISDISERRMDFAADTSFLINNGNLGGASASNTEKLGLSTTPATKIAVISGSGTTSVARIRFNTSSATVTQTSTLIIDHNMNITSSGITAYYNQVNNTNAENCTITINAGKTVTISGGAFHSNLTTNAFAGGSYTYNINGTLDVSNSSTTSYFLPINNSSSVVTLNVSGVLKLANFNSNYSGAFPGAVVLNILNGGLIDATRSATFNLGSKYFIVSGSGKLKRPVPISAGAVTFPVGTSATAYNPVVLTASSADDTFSVNVSNALSYSIGDPTRIVNKQWELTPAGAGTGFNGTFAWQTADQAAGFSQSAPLRIFRYSTAAPAGWAPIATASAITGSGTVAAPYTTGPSTAPSALAGLYVVGDSDAAVIVIPTVSISAAPGSTICAGTQVAFTAATTNIVGPHYQWKVNGVNVGTDSVKYTTSALANGAVVTCVISYVVSGPAAATSNAVTMTVNPQPLAGTISGSGSVCTGTTEPLTGSVSGGVWSSSNTAVATVSSTGVVAGVSVGTATISYSVTNSCGTAIATKAMAVTLGASAGTISGTATVCPTATTTLSSTAPGGTWLTNNSSIATVSSSGVVTGVAAGSATIAYVVTNGCGTDTARRTVTVNPPASAGTITGPSIVCALSTITLANTVSGGTWSSSNANATVSGGVVTGVTTGTSVITYTVTNTCGTAATTHNITISTIPTVKPIAGPATVCEGAVITLTDSTAGGVWSSGDPLVLIVSSTGVVTGVKSGITTVIYSVTNTCGVTLVSRTISVDALPAAAIVTGPDSVCLNASITLLTDNENGLWSSASGKTFITTDGIVTGLSVGLDTVMFGVSNQCGTVKTPHIVEVWNCNPLGIGNTRGNGNLLASAYPNPSNGNFVYMLSSSKSESLKLIITDLTGAVVEMKSARTNERISIDLKGAAGMYFLTAITSEGRTVTKLNITE